MAFKSFYVKLGRLRLYDGTTPTPRFLEIPFRGNVTAPVDRPRPGETLILDRGRVTEHAHYVQQSDEAILAPLPFACSFLLANTEPNFSKFLTAIRSPAITASTKTIGGQAWATVKGTSQVQDANPEGRALITTPAFADPAKWCVDVELLYADPDAAQDRGFRWNEVYFPPDRQMTEGETEVRISLDGEIYGAIDLITAFTAGLET